MNPSNNLSRRSVSAILAGLILTLVFVAAARAQVATGGAYRLEQSVVASGGGASADASGGVFRLESTIGEAVAGTTSTNAPYKIKGGFLTAAPFAPTAAGVTVGGRVMTADGRGIRSVLITITDMSGATRTTVSSAFGRFRFADVSAGGTYILSVRGKRFAFAQPVQVYSITEDIEDIIFIGEASPLQNP